jgi:hypothetical protein
MQWVAREAQEAKGSFQVAFLAAIGLVAASVSLILALLILMVF